MNVAITGGHGPTRRVALVGRHLDAGRAGTAPRGWSGQSGFVSLQAGAADDRGNTVVQEVVRAYGLS